jgi:hypothetical protein
MTIEVVNKYKYQGANGVYIGRPSLLGNPYEIGKDGTRDGVIDKYAAYALNAYLNDVRWYNSLNGLAKLCTTRHIDLVCYCKPQRCHGDVLKSMIEEIVGDQMYGRCETCQGTGGFYPPTKTNWRLADGTTLTNDGTCPTCNGTGNAQ